jgi:transposase InsO family protein
LAAIVVEHIASKRRYGSPRIHAELQDQGWRVGVNRIARLMAEQGIEGRSSRMRRHSLTRQAKVAPDIPDLLERDFTAEQPDTRWVTDISYVPTAEGWVYLAVIQDLASKAVVGWAARPHMRTSLVLEALSMATTARQPAPGLIVHSDRGSQYTSAEWLDALTEVDAKRRWAGSGSLGTTPRPSPGSAGSRSSWSTRSERSPHAIRPSWRSPATSAGTTPPGATRRCNIAAHTSGSAPLPSPVPPDLTVSVPAGDGASNDPASLLTTLTGGRMKVAADTARRLVDEAGATIRTIVLEDTGQILGVGRKNYQPPGWLRDALLVRDQTCRAPHCLTAARRCDLDHADPWTAVPGPDGRTVGGPTDIINLAHLCRTDHGAKDRDGWHVYGLTRGRQRGLHRWTHRRTGLTIDTAPAARRLPLPTAQPTPRAGPAPPTGHARATNAPPRAGPAP